jgi:formamidopyrimidine-DNA glycosylase
MMPELPEVQTIVNDLQTAGIVGQAITGVDVYWPATISTGSPENFRKRIQGKTILGVGRRGKLILFELDDGWLLGVHLRMTGRFELMADHPRDKHVHVVLALKDGRRLWFRDTRKFGRFYLVEDPLSITGALGLEPLCPQFTAGVLAGVLSGRKRRIKPLLLDQGVIAGLGNIYVDEALWTARIHPLCEAASLSWPAQIKALHRGIRSVLRQGLRNAGTTLGGGKGNFYSLESARGRNADQLKVFRRTGQPCPRCRTPIERIVVAQRSTHLCPQCQKAFGCIRTPMESPNNH